MRHIGRSFATIVAWSGAISFFIHGVSEKQGLFGSYELESRVTVTSADLLLPGDGISKTERDILAADVDNKTHKAFILVGASRTLNHTHRTILINLMEPTCPPETCVAHLFTHLSQTDNRPDTNQDDPRGKVVEQSNEYQSYFWNDGGVSPDYLKVHEVPSYNIGSVEELAAFDVLEAEAPPESRPKLRILRVGDPRRYSMWSSRAWAWRFVRKFEASQGKF